jgi:molybdopterin-biosynthesis enzyme MoeA-like protein
LDAEIVAVGSEFLLGQTVDTNSAVIAFHFATIGLNLFSETTVGDTSGGSPAPSPRPWGLPMSS